MSYVDGADDVLHRLEKLDRDMQGQAMRQALLAGAQAAEGYIKANARKEFYEGDTTEKGHRRHVTGNLLNSIASSVTLAGRPEAAVSVGAEYGVYLEKGTSRGIRARHYVERGVKDNLPSITRAAIAKLKRLLGI